eukprot:CAMPEP_0202717032 /NCGR_PEP_ID=MMETSP1385-20130828/107331_1 /ASSEMBLY_ACC=CAM_ASM_000861 /TAXON_ID=933848 /ORGANISM="Elphidium margaritaceum" /LENGTH=242 /DNA_ID=CAMNT_0049379059 /DNA_START=38 /DNA_END=763 /DNA_ORIENTATION=+
MPSDEDSDLEILPPVKREYTTVNLEDDAHNQHNQEIVDAMHQQQTSRNRNPQKRVIVKDEDSNGTQPSPKRRRLDREHQIDPKPEFEQYVNINQETTIKRKKKNTKKKGKAKNNTCYFRHRSGLYYAGNCMNSQCVAYTKPVTCGRGYGNSIKPISDRKNKRVVCPKCRAPFAAKSIFLNNCTAVMQYQFSSDLNAESKTIDASSGKYVVFGVKRLRDAKVCQNNSALTNQHNSNANASLPG